MCFFVRTFKSISALTKLSHAGRKFYAKMFAKDYNPIFEISLSSFIHKKFLSIRYITVYLVQIWTSIKMHVKNGYCVNLP